jgi:hypothetical protein
VIGPVVCDPLRFFIPLHASEAAHDVALLLLQASVAGLPELTVLGVARMLTVGAAALTGGGAGCVTTTCADCDAEPPAPLHASV